MASTAFINTIAVLAIAESQANTLLEKLPEDDLMELSGALKAVKHSCDHAFTQWPGQLDSAGMKRLNAILDAFQNYLQDMEIENYTSLTLALLAALEDKLKEKKANPWKIRAVRNLIGAFFVVHKHFDPDMQKFVAYLVAEDLRNRWSKLMEAEDGTRGKDKRAA